MKKSIFVTISFLGLFLSIVPSFAALTVSPIFGSDMVLQRRITLPVFGTADPGSTVNVRFNGQDVTAAADASGRWKAFLQSMEANSSPLNMTIVSGSSTITFTGVQVGEVWLCSGQSNMGFPLSSANNSAPAISDAGNHNIRLFKMTGGSGPSTTTWKVSSSTTAAGFSAVGYWMGLELSQWFGNVPVGLIQATHDGTAIASWQHTSGGTGVDYDAMVKAIQPFAIKGVAWYQGESNGGDAQYASKLTNMINEWRTDWGIGVLPFGIIQLAYRSGWNVCRNAQMEVADQVPGCYLVVIRDLPGGALHPPEKKPVGIRTAIGARGLVYGENITWSGPIRDIPNCYVSGTKIYLNFKHTGNGLFTSDGKIPGDFKVATATGQFKTATAVLSGNTVILTSPVANPARVQHAYSSVGNLYNRVTIYTEGGKTTVDRLKVSEFQITLPSAKSAFIPGHSAESGITVYPNPSPDGRISVDIQNPDFQGKVIFRIFDMRGREVFIKTANPEGPAVLETRLGKGLYILRMQDDNHLLSQQKFTIH